MGLDLVVRRADQAQRAGFGRRQVTRQDLINFCFHLEQLAAPGVPLVEGLTDLRDSVENPRFREVISGLIEDIQGGQNLSQALADYPEVFSKVFVSLVRSGEQTGTAAGGAAEPGRDPEVGGRARGADQEAPDVPGCSSACIVLVVTFFLMIYLVPQMVGLIKNMGQDAPAADAAS